MSEAALFVVRRRSRSFVCSKLTEHEGACATGCLHISDGHQLRQVRRGSSAEPAARRLLRHCFLWPRRCRCSSATVAFCLALFFCVVAADVSFGWELPHGSRTLRPRYARIAGPWWAKLPPGDEVEAVWQRPHGTVRGILFFVHGCSHQATDLFTNVGSDGWELAQCNTSNFNTCLGLPEHVLLRQTVRARGYLFVAASGGTGRQSCWDTRRDVTRVRMVIEHVRLAEGLVDAPVVLMGGLSPDNAFFGELALTNLPHLSCIVAMNTPIGVSGMHSLRPPTVFQHMSRDVATASVVRRDISALRRRGIPVSELEVHPVPVTAAFLARGGRGIEASTAANVVSAFRAKGLLNSQGFLKDDPLHSNWPSAVRRLKADVGGFGWETSKLGELLQLAYAFRGCFGGFAGQALDFCHSNAPNATPQHRPLPPL
eukprot:TRINITY_DN44879_c0_g1_i1.p1 TRINITY_DN44879_c0_g1~~TRINITY_DN44879_c0_g1_i1.p1  ORF type:complete len:428 (-),score=38.97 TRINITY_DN44879_c0_g1_i1:2-1285(-)